MCQALCYKNIICIIQTNSHHSHERWVLFLFSLIYRLGHCHRGLLSNSFQVTEPESDVAGNSMQLSDLITPNLIFFA